MGLPQRPGERRPRESTMTGDDQPANPKGGRSTSSASDRNRSIEEFAPKWARDPTLRERRPDTSPAAPSESAERSEPVEKASRALYPTMMPGPSRRSP